MIVRQCWKAVVNSGSCRIASRLKLFKGATGHYLLPVNTPLVCGTGKGISQ